MIFHGPMEPLINTTFVSTVICSSSNLSFLVLVPRTPNVIAFIDVYDDREDAAIISK